MGIMKIKIFLISLIISLLSCQNRVPDIIEEKQKEQRKDMQEILQIIENNKKDERQNPFLTREFSPYLGEDWIGEAVSYGCYRKGQAPYGQGPSESEILEDLEIIKNYWNLIRVYGSDDDSERILKVISDYNLPIKMMLGVWLENETDFPERKKENSEQVLKAIKLGNQYADIISAISVGNETQVFWSGHRMETSDLIKYIRLIRNNTSVPVTTADDYNFWNKPISNSVASEIDFIVVHIYPLWNGITLENSIDWMNDIYFNDIKRMHPGKEIVLGEIGWATDYDASKTGDGQQGSLIKGEVSLSAQEKFLRELSKWTNQNKVTTFLFEAFDEPWKGGGENSNPREIEKHWGVFYENRMPKESFINIYNP